MRSAFLLGRPMGAISSKERVLARELARRVVEALVNAAAGLTEPSREAYLETLLNKGISMPGA